LAREVAVLDLGAKAAVRSAAQAERAMRGVVLWASWRLWVGCWR
jgi:hypothetical protein